MSQTVLKIEGMACNGCRGKVEKALQGIAGVTSANVSLEKKEAVVIGSVSSTELVKSVEELGFTVVG